MNFRPELAEAVIAGRKTVTRRAVSENPKSPYHPDRAPRMAGRRIAICPGRGKPQIGTAVVDAVLRERFDPAEITGAEARREGFRSRLAFLDTWARLHGGFDPIEVWRIGLSSVEPAP